MEGSVGGLPVGLLSVLTQNTSIERSIHGVFNKFLGYIKCYDVEYQCIECFEMFNNHNKLFN